MIDFWSGAIAVINEELGNGTIIDENCQDISFLVEDAPKDIELNSKVIFEVVLGNSGLMASNIKLI